MLLYFDGAALRCRELDGWEEWGWCCCDAVAVCAMCARCGWVNVNWRAMTSWRSVCRDQADQRLAPTGGNGSSS